MQAMQSEGNINKEDLLCKGCATEALGYGKSMCDKHGNEFVDWKCMFCCSIALFYCSGGTGDYCTPCHNDAMAGKRKVQTNCTGGKDCKLGLDRHPKADANPNKGKYPLGCSLCRSEHLALIGNNDKADAGVNLERRGSMIQRFGGVKGHDIGREMRIIKAPEPPKPKPSEKVPEKKKLGPEEHCCTIF